MDLELLAHIFFSLNQTPNQECSLDELLERLQSILNLNTNTKRFQNYMGKALDKGYELGLLYIKNGIVRLTFKQIQNRVRDIQQHQNDIFIENYSNQDAASLSDINDSPQNSTESVEFPKSGPLRSTTTIITASAIPSSSPSTKIIKNTKLLNNSNNKNSNRTKILGAAKLHTKKYQKLRSVSLPNIFIQTQFPSATSTDNEILKSDQLSSNLTNQIRAVSSPSLNYIEEKQQNNYFVSSAECNNSKVATNITSNNHKQQQQHQQVNQQKQRRQQQNNAGVLHKFKKTFSQFKTSSTGTTVNNINLQQQQQTPPSVLLSTHNNIINCNDNNGIGNVIGNQIINGNYLNKIDATITSTSTSTSSSSSGKYKFGPLIWRSSKERRKTKYNRRDKCNSGDSGIQIELENDENFNASDVGGGYGGIIENREGRGSAETLPSIDSGNTVIHRVRRTNSAKTTNSMIRSCSSSAKTKALRKIECNDHRIAATPLPKRSLSQPSGLDRMARAETTTDRNILIPDLDESDTDSVSSHPDLHEGNRTIYAEVLFPFAPAGPQELPLEKGLLIEILRKDGPWWYGRYKHDAIIEKVIDNKQGWFPKDFVRIIPPLIFGQQKQQQQNHQKLELDNENEENQQQQQQIYKRDQILLNRRATANNTLVEFNKKCDTRLSNSNNNVLINNNHNTSNNKNSCNTTTILSSSSSSSIISPPHPPAKSIISTSTALLLSPTSSTASSSSSSTSTGQAIGMKTISITSHHLRNNVIKELLETEINYVKLLSSLCLGYLKELRKRIDIFSTESLNIIFSNIENVWNFQKSFLDSLRKGIENGRIAQVFLEHHSGFLVYSTYCNSYPRALMELETYSNSKEAKCVLENCRIAENLPELPLSAHLLAPIQRICRYPLHLAELVKHTPTRQEILSQLNQENINCNLLNYHDKMDDCKETLEIALAEMKKVTETVNEGKRHSEHLTRFQASFENFQGPPIACHSTKFFMQTDATRVLPNLWNNTYTLFLFDHQLIYCKKDILKRNHYIYKGRIFLDNCRILNLPNGKLFGATVKNALRIFCQTRNKWFDFCFRSPNRKTIFLSSLAIERQFCGSNLFVSELVGDNDDDNLSDREYQSDCDLSSTSVSAPSRTRIGKMGQANTLERDINVENFYNMNLNYEYSGFKQRQTSSSSFGSDTLPKKSRKIIKEGNGGSSSSNGYEYGTSSLGRRRIGNWFRKAKSTNSTPTQSPTHQQQATAVIMAAAAAAAAATTSFTSDSSSSQSSPALGGTTTSVSSIATNKSKMKDAILSS